MTPHANAIIVHLTPNPHMRTTASINTFYRYHFIENHEFSASQVSPTNLEKVVLPILCQWCLARMLHPRQHHAYWEEPFLKIACARWHLHCHGLLRSQRLNLVADFPRHPYPAKQANSTSVEHTIRLEGRGLKEELPVRSDLHLLRKQATRCKAQLRRLQVSVVLVGHISRVSSARQRRIFFLFLYVYPKGLFLRV
jgi:hypothetical protein